MGGELIITRGGFGVVWGWIPVEFWGEVGVVPAPGDKNSGVSAGGERGNKKSPVWEVWGIQSAGICLLFIPIKTQREISPFPFIPIKTQREISPSPFILFRTQRENSPSFLSQLKPRGEISSFLFIPIKTQRKISPFPFFPN